VCADLVLALAGDHSAPLNQKMALGALDQSFNDRGEPLRTPVLRKPPQIVGHSLGGRLAVLVAGGFPVGVIAVIFCGLASQPMTSPALKTGDPGLPGPWVRIPPPPLQSQDPAP
jgi:hypothetical protein